MVSSPSPDSSCSTAARSPSEDLDARQPVAIVNAAFARKHYGTESAVGRRFRTVGNNGQLPGPWRTIVGVVSSTSA